MAVLGATSLTGCSSIPSFIATGSRMVFEQTAAPTSWTKETNAAFNDVALRAVTGAVSSGGSTPFVTVFPNSPRGLAAVPLAGPSNLSVQPSGTILGLQASTADVSVQGQSLASPTIISHSHTYQQRSTGQNANAAGQLSTRSADAVPAPQVTIPASGNAGGGGQHSHGISDSGHAGHSINTGDHSHGVQEASHSHQFTMTARDFRLLYMDVIICTKD